MIHHNDETQAAPFEKEVPSSRQRDGRGLSNARAKDFGLRAPTELGKNFVIDTNVLLHDPGCLGRFKDNHLCVPVDVLSELDRFKNEQTERGANSSTGRLRSSVFEWAESAAI